MIFEILLASSLVTFGGSSRSRLYEGSAPTWARVMVRQTENFKVVEQGKVQQRVEHAHTSRASRNGAIGKRNQDNVVAVSKAPRSQSGTVKTRPAANKVLNTEYQVYFDADINLPVEDENKSDLANFPLEVAKEVDAPGKTQVKPQFEKTATSADGTIQLKSVRLPVTIRVRTDASQPQASEWELDGDEDGQAFAALLPEGSEGPYRPEKGDRVGKPVQISSVKKGNTITITRRVEVHRHVAMNLEGAAHLRRTVADFEMPKPSNPVAVRNLKPHVFLGTKEVDLEDAGGSWKFRIPRDDIDDAEATFVVQADKGEAKFGGATSADKIDFYHSNRLPTPALELEAFAEGSIVLDGHSVDNSYPLSVLQWDASAGIESASTNGVPDAPPQAVTGRDALKILGFAGKLSEADRNKKHPADWIEVPNPGREEGRYGQWIWLEDKGLGLRCRWELDDGNADKHRKGRKFLPGKSSYGILEGIRVTKPEGGRIGALVVGATRDDVEMAFGSPDVYSVDSIKLLGLGAGASRNKTIFGSSQIEAWDDSFLYGGVRVKWDGNRVAWFEIARPAQLLYNGTKAFTPSVSRGIFIRNVTSNTGDLSTVERIRRWVSEASGVSLCDSESAADLVIDARAVVTTEDVEVQHQHTIKVPKTNSKGQVEHDKNGNTKYEDKLVDESFKCPDVLASCTIQVTVSDREGSVVDRFSLQNTTYGGAAYGHHDGERCTRPSSTLARAAAMNGAPNWRRTFANQMAEGSDMTGCVLDVNYKTGQILINLGSKNGIKTTESTEGTELALYLLHSVDPKTGAIEGDIEDERIIGPGFKEWLEVEKVGDDWCIARPKVKDAIGHTTTAYGIIPRLIDPGSGLVRVRVVAKRGKG